MAEATPKVFTLFPDEPNKPGPPELYKGLGAVGVLSNSKELYEYALARPASWAVIHDHNVVELTVDKWNEFQVWRATQTEGR